VINEGYLGLYKGLSASLSRQFTYSSARIGSYPFMKKIVQPDETKKLNLFEKIGIINYSIKVAAMLSGI
jgi:hypothetical protein